MKTFSRIIIILIIISGFAVPGLAQESGGQDTGAARGQRPSDLRGMMVDPAQMQKMMADRLKELLELSDEEWTVIGPKVIKVFELSMQNRGNGGMMMFMGRPGRQQGAGPGGRRGRPGGDMQESPVDKAMSDLQTLLEKKDASVDDIKAQVIKVRRAKDKVQQEKASAQKELRDLLTVKQEATLIAMGVLD